jgi:hypothetical protein
MHHNRANSPKEFIMTKAQRKIGERKEIGRVELTCRVRATMTTLTEGEQVEDPYRIFEFNSNKGDGKAISMQVVSFGDVQINELVLFDYADGEGLVSAFSDGVFFNPETFSYEKFILPKIGDYLKITGIHYRKWTVLSKSENPKLRDGFWKDCLRAYSPENFKVRRRPPKPTGKKLTKIKAV